MNRSQASDEFRLDLVSWCQYNYGDNLIGLAVFDPTRVDASYPRRDINILMVVNMAPENERERYELVNEMLIQNLARGKSLTCRMQTVGELNMLASLKLPLLDIYLRDAEIIHDPQNVLATVRENLQS